MNLCVLIAEERYLFYQLGLLGVLVCLLNYTVKMLDYIINKLAVYTERRVIVTGYALHIVQDCYEREMPEKSVTCVFTCFYCLLA